MSIYSFNKKRPVWAVFLRFYFQQKWLLIDYFLASDCIKSSGNSLALSYAVAIHVFDQEQDKPD